MCKTAQLFASALWKSPDVPQESVWFWTVVDAVRSALNSSTRIAARPSLAIIPRGWNAISAPVPQLQRGSAEHTQKADPANTTPKFIRMEKAFSQTASISAHASTELLAVSRFAHKNFLCLTWAALTQG